ncbi:hypothetical protein ACEV9E_03860 [Vibrio parahaemolyticus]|uniref:HORMA-1 domain-containing protein n=1 Tax=Vibrio parahaemolyticus TaxID=670 RepID=UPI0004A400EF|nr:hypothetical protein [Vibrio parahaemolyticus]KIT25093.1 hypothetical protein H323_07600 [Vibrio parahaemolyticus VP766]EGR2769640.1 hypothetical protein [Vibrio parahaemolyticus]EGR2834168.1 hypothetical protein [Vibrio parahaemolyticus]EGR2888637.1 hypothetical protein [Vibrio parahaemolyticus]EGR2907142.1 hypothetical protein [Vibrio parahaemolyticus]
MSTYSSTSTYTVADVEKVMRSVKADLMMIAGSTKAMTEEDAANYAHDIEVLAKKDHLEFVDVTLMDGSTEIRAVRYEFQSENATGTERPGGVLWPLISKDNGGSIRIHLRYKDTSSLEKRKELPLKISWVPATTDISHTALTSSEGRGYSSNGFGTNREDFS